MLSRKSPRISLPKGWTNHLRAAVPHVSLAQYAAVYSRSWAVNSMNGRSRVPCHSGGHSAGGYLSRSIISCVA